MIRDEWKQQGFIGEPAPEGIDLTAEIRRMCREKRAVVMAHYYTPGEVQDAADFIGDSLALARKAAETDAQHHAHTSGVGFLHLEAGMRHELQPRAYGKLTEAVHLAALFTGDDFLRLEILYFARDVSGKFGGIKLSDTADAGLAGKKSLPAALKVGAQRRDG